jgi:hypothetical protein
MLLTLATIKGVVYESNDLGSENLPVGFDLSTPEGSRAAHERLATMARRVCTELARIHEPAYEPNYGA